MPSLTISTKFASHFGVAALNRSFETVGSSATKRLFSTAKLEPCPIVTPYCTLFGMLIMQSHLASEQSAG